MHSARPLNIGSVLALRFGAPKEKRRLTTLSDQLEEKTVEEGLRPLGYKLVPEDGLARFLLKLREKDLYYELVVHSGRVEGFMHGYIPPRNGEPGLCGVAFSPNPGLPRLFGKAFLAGDHTTVGELLGYPDCCIHAFASDHLTEPLSRYLNATEIHVHLLASPFLRRIGASSIFHYPCTLNCQNTIDLAHRHAELLDKEDLELLAGEDYMIIESVVHGVFKLETPSFLGYGTTAPWLSGRFVVHHEL